MTPYGTGGVQSSLTLAANGAASTSMTAYGMIMAGQSTVPPGSYPWTTTSPLVGYAYTTAACPISNPFTNYSGLNATVWTATVLAYCSVTATALNFGNSGVLSAAVTGASQLSVICTNTTPYTVALDGGLTGATNPAQRKMTKGSEFIYYGLYSDTARTVPLGSGAGATLSGVGTGLTQNFNVYGKVAAQTTPSPGTYSDTVVVTITY
jgi:spore coat protein U-like protein